MKFDTHSTTSRYLPIIGMEVHAELNTKSKMFCGCKNDPFHAPKPNIYTCPVCLGMPGGIPYANQKAVEWTMKLGLALNCEINLFSKFDRKNYFYPDLAKGYQISQYEIPFCVHGVLDTEEGPVRIRRIHLEEDTGKLQHRTLNGKKVSLIDFNRSGVPLIEIVTEPDIHSAAHAKAYAKKLRQIIRYLDISDCDMEQGSMRLEANISLLNTDKPNELINEADLPPYKVEVKNINSFTYLAKAIEFEIYRHQDLLEKNETPVQETRGWDEDSKSTFSQRSKEDAEDYRYFPDPDLPPIAYSHKQIETIRREIPELPDQIVARWQQEYGVESRYASVLTETPELSKQADELFIAAKQENRDVNKFANAWVNKKLMVKTDSTVSQVLAQFNDLFHVASVDESELKQVIDSVLAAHPDAVVNYKAGKIQVIGFLIGQVMRGLGKKVDPQIVKAAVEEALG